MRRWGWLLLAVVLAGAGWGWRESLFPGEATRVRRSLESLASQLSFTPNEGGIAAGRRISQGVEAFAPDAVIQVDILGAGSFNLNGRGEIQQTFWAARKAASRCDVRFFDIVPELGADGRTASVHLTATVEARGHRRNQESFEAMEFRFQLEKLDGSWKVRQVETVPTLKQ